MKNSNLLIIAFIFLTVLSARAQNPEENKTDVLIGEWILDMSPQDKNDENFAMMKIESVGDMRLTGIFYREGVPMQHGRINTQTDLIYGALISGDGTGDYNTSFYYKDGILYGTTHAIERDFLSVWTATKRK
jgi:hypothetical protein